jgi:3-oxoacid CoA-transferase subunit A
MSHTAPLRYKPFEVLLPGIDQSTVDESMEIWMDAIYDDANHETWYCGHWHVDKTIDKMCFMYNDIILFDETSEDNNANN